MITQPLFIFEGIRIDNGEKVRGALQQDQSIKNGEYEFRIVIESIFDPKRKSVSMTCPLVHPSSVRLVKEFRFKGGETK